MNAAIIKNTLRKVWKTKGRFLAITAIIAIGSGFFTGVKVTSPSMKQTAQNYYENTNLMDFRFVSTLGFDDDDISNIKNLQGVTELSAGYTADLFFEYDGAYNSIVRVYSYNENDSVNKPTLVSGAMPQNDNECVIDDELKGIFPIGSTISLSTESNESAVSDYLSYNEYKVVGTVDWSMYIDFERGSTTLGSGKINAFMLVNDTSFNMQAYTAVYVKCAELENVNPFSDEFEDISEEKGKYFEDCMQTLAQEKSDRIYSEFVNDPDFVKAQNDYETGLAEYEQAYSEYETQLAELEQFINDANIQISDYTTLIETATAEYESGIASYNTQIEALEQSEIDLAAREEQANADEVELTNQQNTLDGLYLTINQYSLYSASQPYPESLQTALDNAATLDTAAVSVSAALEAFVTAEERDKRQARGDLDDIIDLKENSFEREAERIEAERSDIATARTENEAKAAILQQTKTELDAAKAEIDTNQVTLDEYVNQVSTAMAESETIRTEAEAQFGETEQALSQAKLEIDNAYAEIEELCADVEWYSFDRNSNIGYSDFGTNADRVDSIAKVFPIFFIIVAVLVCLTTMARMVEEERVEMGTLKALGYSRTAILWQYIAYSVAASIIGCVAGLTIGVSIIPKVIFEAYLLMYIMPEMELIVPAGYIIGCVTVSLACTVITAIVTCTHALAETPSSLMRPKAPKEGKRVLLERFGFIWNRLSFNAKVTARNVFRFKSRVLMTIIGISGCTALLLTAFTLKYAISAIVDKQYGEIFNYDALLYHDDKADIAEIDVILQTNQDITEFTHALQKSFEISANGNSYDGYVVVPDDANALKSFIALRQPETYSEINITGGGAVINQKLAQVLDVAVGDEIALGETKTKVKVAAVTENYTFNYVYMSKSLYTSLFGEEKTNIIYANLAKDTDCDALFETIGEDWKGSEGTLSVSFTKDSGQSFRDLVDTLDYIVLVVLAASGALAFVVLYNLNNINIVERLRELATLKVLGFYDGEVSAYVYRETTITALLGTAAGLILGTFLAKFVVVTAEVDVVMFARDIPLYCYVLAALVTIVFVVIVNIFMYIKLKNIDMAASMKAVE